MLRCQPPDRSQRFGGSFFRLELVTYYVNPLDLSTEFLSQKY